MVQRTRVTGFLSTIYNENGYTVAVYTSAWNLTENYRLVNDF